MPRSYFGKPFVTSVSLLVVACLDANPGNNESTAGASTGASTGGETDATGGSTLDGIMTTTEEPESESSSDTGTTTDEETTSTTTGTTEMIPPGCGNGVIDEDEQCDNGNANADDAACTKSCHDAFCGDGIVDPVEECDADSPDSGCLKGDCSYATSCLALRDAWGPQAGTGVYKIHPKDNVDVDAFCDMDTDDGGYTFVKYGGVAAIGAAAAEAKCGTIGMRLLVPRTPAHLEATIAFVQNNDIAPAEGMPPLKASNYMKIFGIYPKDVGASCVDAPLNMDSCPEWEASDKGAWWISDATIGQGQPGVNNCDQCSMAYYWDNLGTDLTGYEVVYGGGVGADSTHFLCDVGDKQGMD